MLGNGSNITALKRYRLRSGVPRGISTTTKRRNGLPFQGSATVIPRARSWAASLYWPPAQPQFRPRSTGTSVTLATFFQKASVVIVAVATFLCGCAGGVIGQIHYYWGTRTAMPCLDGKEFVLGRFMVR